MIFEDKGIDGNKKINGRKRQVMVDTGGLIWACNVHGERICPHCQAMGQRTNFWMV
jgi:hypothetical protein